MAEQQPVFTPVEDTTDDGKAAIYDAATNKVVWAAAGSPPPMPASNALMADASVTTHYLSTPGVTGWTSLIPTLDRMYLDPIFVGSTFTATEMAFRLNSAQGSGSTMRLVLYRDNGAGKPGELLIYSSAIASDSGTNVKKTVSVSQALTPGMYWIGSISRWVSSAGSVRAPTTTAMGAFHLWYPESNFAGSFYWDSVTGDPPDPPGAPSGMLSASGGTYVGIR